jgi:hypothetical protein
MADTIKLGGINVPKPVAIGGGIAAVTVGIYFYRNKKQQQDAQASIDAAGSTEIDPATGYPYGSPEDAASLNNQDNYSLPGGYGFSGYAGGSGSGVFGNGAPGSFNSNAEWAQYVENYEVTNLGGDAPTVGNAIGKYLTGQVLTTEQQALVQSAIAIAGYPPVSGPNGNPPGFATAPADNNPPPNGNPPPPPGSTGVGQAKPITGLHIISKTKTSVTIGWNATSAPQGYNYMLKQLNGKIITNSQTTATHVTIGGLHSGFEYNFSIHGIPNGVGNAIHVSKLP